MKTMAWRLLSLLLFYSLAVVWADDSLPIPDYEDTLPLRESACWVSIKMEEMGRLWKIFHKRNGMHDKLQDSGGLFSSDINKTLLKEAKIKEFKWMPCYAKPSEAADVFACEKIALAACPSTSFKNVLLIYGIQLWKKDEMHESLLKVAKMRESIQKQSKEAKIPQVIKIALFIDCQNPTGMDMKENPTGCHGGRRLDFDPTFSKHFPRAQIEIHSDGNLSDTEIYPGGLLAWEKIEGSFLMTLDDDIYSKCFFIGNSAGGFGKYIKKIFRHLSRKKVYPNNEVRAIKATNEGIVLFDANYKELPEENRECVLKNSTEEQRSLWIHRKTEKGIKETFEHKLKPNESVNVKLLPHIEIYPFFSVPELVVGKSAEQNKEKSKEPLYVYHLKVQEDEAREAKLAAISETERLRHENLYLKTVTCRKTENKSALQNCLKEYLGVSQARRVFLSSSNRNVLNEAMYLFSSSLSEKGWKPHYETMSAKYKFIEVGGRLNPDPQKLSPRPLGRFERLKRRFLNFVGWNKNFANIDAQSFTKGELHLDVALFHAYRPLHPLHSAVQIAGSEEIGCFDEMKIEFFGSAYEFQMKRRSEKGFYLENEERRQFHPWEYYITNDSESLRIHDYYKVEPTRILQNVSEMKFLPSHPVGTIGNLWLNCKKWHPKREGEGDSLRVDQKKVTITFFEISLRSTVIFQ